MDGVKSRLIPTIQWFVTVFFFVRDLQLPYALHAAQINFEMKVLNILSVDTIPHYCCAGECYNSSD